MTSRYFPASMSCLRKRTSFSPAWPMTPSLSGLFRRLCYLAEPR
jgi:hypothetical protein